MLDILLGAFHKTWAGIEGKIVKEGKSKMRQMIISLLLILLVNCSGGRAAIKLEKAQVPVSLSSFLYSEDGKVLAGQNKASESLNTKKDFGEFFGLKFVFQMMTMLQRQSISR